MASKDTKDIPLGHYSNLPDEVLFKVLKESGNPATMGVDRRTRSIVGGECEKQTYGGLKCEGMNKICDTYCREYTGSAIMNEVDSLLASPMYNIGVRFHVSIKALSDLTGSVALQLTFTIEKLENGNDSIVLTGTESISHLDHVMLNAGIASRSFPIRVHKNIIGYDTVSKVVLGVSEDHVMVIESVEASLFRTVAWTTMFRKAAGIYDSSSTYSLSPPGTEIEADGFLAMCYDVLANKQFAHAVKEFDMVLSMNDIRTSTIDIRTIMKIKLAKGADIASVTTMDELADILRISVHDYRGSRRLQLGKKAAFLKGITWSRVLPAFLEYNQTTKVTIHDFSIVWKDIIPRGVKEKDFSLSSQTYPRR
jgi:hypothetical protein